MIALASAKVDTAFPSTDTIRSPGFTPASAAGAIGSEAAHVVRVDPAGSTHCDTEAIVVVPCWIPIPLSSTVKITTASTRFMSGPPSMTMIRFQTGSR